MNVPPETCPLGIKEPHECNVTPLAPNVILEGWMLDWEEVEGLAVRLERMAKTSYKDDDIADMAAEVIRKVLLPMLSPQASSKAKVPE